MAMTPDRIAIIVGAALAILLQIALAPYIAIMSAMPNFVIVFVMIVAVSRPYSYGAALPFVLGLLYDLTAGGPVGAMAFSLTAFSYVTARLYVAFENDTLFMPLAMIGLGSLATELSYGLFLMLNGYNASLFEAIAYQVVPCFAYDLVIGVILYLFTSRFFRQSGSARGDIIQFR